MPTELMKGIDIKVVTIETLWLEWSTALHALILYSLSTKANIISLYRNASQ